MQRSNTAARHPYLFSLLILVVFTAVNLASIGLGIVVPELSALWLELLTELVLALLAIVLVTALHYWRKAGFRWQLSLKDLRLYWVPLFPLVPVLIPVATGIGQLRFSDVVFYLALAGLIGFVEEVYFRGLMLRALVPLGLCRAAVITSVLFGAMHLQNLLFGEDPAATVLQVGYAAAMGFGFAAVTLRTGTIWPLVIIHALMNFAGFVTSGETVMNGVSATDLAVYGFYIFLFVAYGVFLMRSMTRSQAHGLDESTSPRR